MARPAMTPRVGIGLPVFNGERYLEQTLDALLAQTFAEFELVIADNGSTDRTEAICRAAAARDERVRYERSPVNRGATWNFNRSFMLPRGEYFKWSAYDDLCEPTFVERGVEALDATPAAVLAYPRTRLIDGDGTVVGDHDDNLALRQPTAHERLAAVVAALGYANPAHGVIRADALRKTRLFGAYASTDYVLLAELALLGQFVEIPERLFVRRIHPASSRAANPDAASAAAWFRPGARARFRAESWRLCLEHVVAIAHAPLPLAERGRCLAAFAQTGGRRYGHHLVSEFGGLVRAAAGSQLTGSRRPL
jgi:glycosyltransferase involved in cell wall biosynthesis